MNPNHDDLGRFASAVGGPAGDKSVLAVESSRRAERSGGARDHDLAAIAHFDAAYAHESAALAHGSNGLGAGHRRLAEAHTDQARFHQNKSQTTTSRTHHTMIPRAGLSGMFKQVGGAARKAIEPARKMLT